MKNSLLAVLVFLTMFSCAPRVIELANGRKVSEKRAEHLYAKWDLQLRDSSRTERIFRKADRKNSRNFNNKEIDKALDGIYSIEVAYDSLGEN